jgi:hypothetical protein
MLTARMSNRSETQSHSTIGSAARRNRPQVDFLSDIELLSEFRAVTPQVSAGELTKI